MVISAGMNVCCVNVDCMAVFRRRGVRRRCRAGGGGVVLCVCPGQRVMKARDEGVRVGVRECGLQGHRAAWVSGSRGLGYKDTGERVSGTRTQGSLVQGHR